MYLYILFIIKIKWKFITLSPNGKNPTLQNDYFYTIVII